MYKNIGRKIKKLAKICCWLGITYSLIAGAILLGCTLWFVLFVIVGALLSWVGSLALYGFGQLIENTDILVEQGKNKPTVENPTPTHTAAHKWRCLNCGNMISEEVCPYCGSKQVTDSQLEKYL